ncbi:MAG: cation-translocating P-type ATPase, partial [Gammaproteobacteria bacterium]
MPGEVINLAISGMDCANCAKTIERGVAQLSGVESVHVSFATESLEAHGDISVDALSEKVRQLGFGVVATDAHQPGAGALSAAGVGSFMRHLWREWSTRSALIGATVIALLAAVNLFAGSTLRVPLDVTLIATVLVVGFPIATKGVRALLYAQQITIDLLMAIAALGALFIGAYGEAAAVMMLFALGEALEGYSAARSRDAIGSLIRLQPDTATVIEQHDGHTHHQQRAIDTLTPGQQIIVKAGERVPADGRIVDGESAIDESAITGEPNLVTRGVGSEVFAGAINGDGTLVIEVTSRPGDFTIARIARLVEQAQASRSPAERYVDRFAQWYTPAVVVLAVLVAAVPPLLAGQPFLNPEAGGTGWLYRGLALLIIACPCALVLSIPVTVVSSIAKLAKDGVLVKGGAQLSELARVRVFAFDKTGTLTHGRPVVSGLRGVDCAHDPEQHAGCEPCNEVVAVAAAVESGSSHPLANAVLHEAGARVVDARYGRATQVQNHAGRGVSGYVGGSRVSVGNAGLAEQSTGVETLLGATKRDNASLVIVSRDDKALGLIEVSDAVRSEVTDSLRALKSIDPAFRFVMLTGDRREVADALAEAIGCIDEVRSELLPDQKLGAVRELEAAYGKVAMIGDGINDTPAL